MILDVPGIELLDDRATFPVITLATSTAPTAWSKTMFFMPLVLSACLNLLNSASLAKTMQPLDPGSISLSLSMWKPIAVRSVLKLGSIRINSLPIFFLLPAGTVLPSV